MIIYTKCKHTCTNMIMFNRPINLLCRTYLMVWLLIFSTTRNGQIIECHPMLMALSALRHWSRTQKRVVDKDQSLWHAGTDQYCVLLQTFCGEYNKKETSLHPHLTPSFIYEYQYGGRQGFDELAK